MTANLTAAYEDAFSQYDVLVMPTIPFKAPELPPADVTLPGGLPWLCVATPALSGGWLTLPTEDATAGCKNRPTHTEAYISRFTLSLQLLSLLKCLKFFWFLLVALWPLIEILVISWKKQDMILGRKTIGYVTPLLS